MLLASPVSSASLCRLTPVGCAASDVGREVAEQTYEKHCFFTRLLTEAGVDPKTAEQDACRMEHVISENSFRHLKQSMDKKE